MASGWTSQALEKSTQILTVLDSPHRKGQISQVLEQSDQRRQHHGWVGGVVSV